MGNGQYFARKNYVENLYATQMLNSNLTREQHLMIQKLSSARHKLHSMGWKVYAGRPMADEVKELKEKYGISDSGITDIIHRFRLLGSRNI